jgi:hypothetical protein
MDVLSAFKKITKLESELNTVESGKNSIQQDHVAAQGKVSLLEAVIERMKQQRSGMTRNQDWSTESQKILELEARNERTSRENDELRQQVMAGFYREALFTVLCINIRRTTHVKISQLVNKMCSQQACSKLVNNAVISSSCYNVVTYNMLTNC